MLSEGIVMSLILSWCFSDMNCQVHSISDMDHARGMGFDGHTTPSSAAALVIVVWKASLLATSVWFPFFNSSEFPTSCGPRTTI